jgi:hypothetical protein
MKKTRKARKSPTAKKAKTAKAKKAKKARKAVAKARGVAKVAAAAALGCCTIVYDNRPSESVPHVSRADCTRLARASGGVGQWNPGECA